MANEKLTYVNEVFARGYVKTFRKDEYGNRVMVLIVKERKDNLLTLNFVLEQNVARGIGTKDRVLVKGYIRAFSYYNDSLRKQSDVMYFVATSVEHDVPELQQRFGVKTASFYPEPLFRAFVAGRVKAVKQTEGNPWAQLIVETCGGGRDLRACTPTLRYYTAGYLPLFDFVPGDKIVARLSAYTPLSKKSKPGYEYHYQDVVVEDIAYVEKAPREAQAETVDPSSLGLPSGNTMDQPASAPAARPERRRNERRPAAPAPDVPAAAAPMEITADASVFVDDVVIDDSSLMGE